MIKTWVNFNTTLIWKMTCCLSLEAKWKTEHLFCSRQSTMIRRRRNWCNNKLHTCLSNHNFTIKRNSYYATLIMYRFLFSLLVKQKRKFKKQNVVNDPAKQQQQNTWPRQLLFSFFLMCQLNMLLMLRMIYFFWEK